MESSRLLNQTSDKQYVIETGGVYTFALEHKEEVTLLQV